MAIDTGFGFTSTARDVLAGVDLSGQTMIVTGGAGGVGIETVRALAAAGAEVTITARNLAPAQTIVDRLRVETGNDTIEVRQLDLADLSSVRAFAADWDRPLHALINNAGIMALPTIERTAEGRELQFATNFLGHFALTQALYPWLRRAEGARVVAVSSTAHLFAPVIWDDPDFRFLSYEPLLAYAQSKTACILHAVAIAQKWESDGILANALNPGAIATNLQRYTGGLRTPEHLRKTAEQGAATSVLLAASPLTKEVSGRYFEDCNEAAICSERDPTAPKGVAPYALDDGNAERMWAMADAFIRAAGR